ncbi:MAG TPA: PilZ domain-containing protein [Nitrospinae bacterium]|jgi:hypothetical protein|nr:PilZ domain-containing protein [Nitrospinota bacterium]
MAGKEEHREFTRVLISVWVEVRAGDCTIKTHESHDLSMTGISLKQQDTPLAVDTLCEVSVFLEGVEQPPIHMDMKGRVGLSTDQELAVEFKEVDLEGYKHLKSGSLQLAPIRRCRLQRIG